jgi:hypothetical protein
MLHKPFPSRFPELFESAFGSGILWLTINKFEANDHVHGSYEPVYWILCLDTYKHWLAIREPGR